VSPDTSARGGDTPTFLASRHGHAAVIRALAAAGADPNLANDKGWAPLHVAARAGRLTVLKPLLAHGSRLDATGPEGCTAAHLAAKYGHAKTIRLLGRAGADLNALDARGATPAEVAAREGARHAIDAIAEAIEGQRRESERQSPAASRAWRHRDLDIDLEHPTAPEPCPTRSMSCPAGLPEAETSGSPHYRRFMEAAAEERPPTPHRGMGPRIDGPG